MNIHRTLLTLPTILILLFSPVQERVSPALVGVSPELVRVSPELVIAQAVPALQTLGNGCSISSPASNAYSVTVCFTGPGNGSTLSGDIPVTAAVTVAGTNPGVQRMIFYLNDQYLLTDYQTPYTFTLPGTHWMDGSYTLAVAALMRDSFTTQQATLAVNFNNGITTPPTNNNQFQPSSGTTPANGAPFLVAAAGDGASGEVNSGNVINLLASINPNLFLYLGDVYEKGSVSEFYNWYGKQGSNFGRFRSITNPTIGNHEYTSGSATGYFDYWDNIPNYYSFDAGGWHFISLNSNSSSVGVDSQSSQYHWLESDLTAHSLTCTIVYYHHPLFNIGPEGNTPTLAAIWALMAQHNVSIVLNGHDHDYQRWVPLDGSGQPSLTGITEFVAGGAGHGLQTISRSDSRVAYSNSLNPNAFGILKLSLNSSGAAFNYVNSSGSTLDSGVVPCAQSSQDTRPPSVPGGFSVTATNATQVDLNWSASNDDTGVNGYTLYRDGTALATVPHPYLTYADLTAMPATSYDYSVDAFDQAGNHSTAAGPLTVITPDMPPSLTFTTQADTYVSAGSPATNYGGAVSITLDASPVLHGYLRFTVQGLAGTPITRARLLVYSKSNSSLGIRAHAVSDNNWGERTLKNNNAPALGGVLATSGPITASSWVTLDVTSYVTGEGIYSFGLSTLSSTALSFAARESGANAAQLILDFQNVLDTQPPSVPGGVAAAVASPSQVDLSWTASTDNVGVVGYSIIRDGTVLVTVPGSTLAYSDTSLQPATTYTYSVTAFDQLNNTSAPSAPVNATTPDIPASLTFTALADTYVSASSPTINYGTSKTLRLDTSPDQHSYLQFNVQGLAGKTITKAMLMIYTNSTSSLGIRVLDLADNSWGELTLNYNNAPALGGVLASSGPITAAHWITLDVTAYVTAEGTYSFGLNALSSTALSLASLESGANAPQLLLDLQ